MYWKIISNKNSTGVEFTTTMDKKNISQTSKYTQNHKENSIQQIIAN